MELVTNFYTSSILFGSELYLSKLGSYSRTIFNVFIRGWINKNVMCKFWIRAFFFTNDFLFGVCVGRIISFFLLWERDGLPLVLDVHKKNTVFQGRFYYLGLGRENAIMLWSDLPTEICDAESLFFSLVKRVINILKYMIYCDE